MSGLSQNLPEIINGDLVIGLTNSKTIKDLGWHDTATLSQWYQDDPEKRHLGMVNLFSTMSGEQLPLYKNFFENKQVLYVNGADGSFTYDIPVTTEGGIYTNRDMSGQGETLGIDSSVFELALDTQFTAGDVLTYDAMYGAQVIVSSEHEVRVEGDSYVHVVQLVSNDRNDYFPSDKLKKGIQYWKINHGMGEFSTKFSNVSEPQPKQRTMTAEFTLGNHRGVETAYTMYAGMKKFSGATVGTRDFMDVFAARQSELGFDSNNRPYDMFYIGKKGSNGKINKSTAYVGSTLEYLVLLELMKLESHSLLFQRGGLVTDANGTVRLNEGIWHQIRRGRVIKYARKGGITRSHIKEVSAYLFRNDKTKMPHQRRLKFKCGMMAYLNMMEIFREEFSLQLQNMNLLLGSDRVLPKSPVSGSLDALELAPVIVTKVPIPDIGIVEIEHEPSLNYQPLTEKFSRGYTGDGYADTAWSMVIWDASSSEYSNANLPSNTRVANGGSTKSNIYYVQPEDNNMWWGYSNGRYAPDTASGIMSSMKTMSREFWAHSISAGWVRDVTKYVVIELQK